MIIIPFRAINNSPVSFYPLQNMLISPDEIFVELTEDKLPGIKEYYLISNYGRVFNKYTGSFLNICIGTDGYYNLTLVNKDGSTRRMRVNRLVMLAFVPISNPDDLVVNHIDCNPLNNCLWNLEWCTRSENAIHAYNHGLMKSGEDAPTAVITEKEAIEIGRLLQDTTWTYKQIAEYVGGNANVGIVQNINKGRDWRRILEREGIVVRGFAGEKKKRFKLSDEDVHNVCKMFEKYPNVFETNAEYFNFIAEKLDCFGQDLPPKEFRNTLRPLYLKTNHKDIVNQYNF